MLADAVVDASHKVSSNDTNEEDLIYFAHITAHYLCLVMALSSIPVTSHHNVKYPIIADSGANYHMFKKKDFLTLFITL